MSETKTRTATTAHGEVNFETVDCASCGNELPKADAKRFLAGREDRFREKYGKYYVLRVYRNESYDGWICEYCDADETFMGISDTVAHLSLLQVAFIVTISVLVGMALGMILVGVTVA